MYQRNLKSPALAIFLLSLNGWISPTEEYTCTPVCQNGGSCYNNNSCTCTANYTGSACSSPICIPACVNGGTCSSPNTCTCTAGFTGSTCAAATSTATIQPILNSIAPDLIAYWPLTADFGARDALAYQIDGVIDGTAVTATGPNSIANTALNLNNVNSIKFTSSHLNFGATQWSLSMYIKSAVTSGQVDFFYYDNTNTSMRQTGVSWSDIKVQATTTTKLGTVNICGAINDWQYLGITFTSIGKMKIYYHPSYMAIDTPATWGSSSTLYIGHNGGYNVSVACALAGNISITPVQYTSLLPLCSLYGDIKCSPNCVSETCRANLTEIAGYTCTCSAGYTGSTCSTPICSPTCYGTSRCSSPNTCTCQSGWNGTDCSSAICLSGCANGGTCTFPQICTCATGWNGTTCSDAICSSACSNGGTCSAPDTCTCIASWNGTTCTIPVCDPSCANGGTCTTPNTCNCATGYNGTSCTNAICSSACLNGGTCSAPNTCNCATGWNDTTCSNPICNSPCANGGTCIGPDTCSCVNGFNDTFCTNPICTSACANGGTCISPDTCTCVTGWNGTACSNPICTTACENGGTCINPNVCSCTTSYNGTFCTNPICTPECSNGGTCTAPNTCNCALGWNGTSCTNPICSSACSNGGTCSAPNTCTCVSGWNGTTCALAICSSLCASGGTCIGPNICDCVVGYNGTFCTNPICSSACFNGGTCSAPDTCTCASGYNGTTCSNPICSSACANGGTCTGPNTCNCLVGYNDTFCTNPICSFGCANGGTCTSPDTCNCVTGWNGSTCSSPICTTACANGGTCTGPNICSCTASYNGTFCTDPVCSTACANGGTCSAPDTCSCATGWNDTTCTNPICSSSCSNGGTCSAPNTCSCPNGWNDTTCSNPICSSPCVNGGTCTGSNVCVCNGGYNGTFCTNPICSSACLNGGTCSAPNTCSCIAGWNDTMCSKPICNSSCQNGGTCISPNTCSCNVGYNGTFCTNPICSSICLNGATCSAPDTCACVSGWIGTTCSIPVCSSPCANGGTCIGANTCSCTSGYNGTFCTNAICPSGCANGGTCASPNICSCIAGWNGTTCSNPVCITACSNGGTCTGPNVCTCTPSYNGTLCTTPVCSPACANAGTCTSPNVCLCRHGWNGTACEIPVCYSGCANGGTCVGANFCYCATGWNDSTCSTPICSPTCANGGVCIAPNTCSCTAEYNGTRCADPICPGGCANGGTCVAPNVCSCPAEWSGPNCTTVECYLACANGGTCISSDECVCNAGWTGSLCATPFCHSRCENGGTCTVPDICECTSCWKGNNCNLPVCYPNCTEADLPKQSDPLSLAYFCKISDAALKENATKICDAVLTTSEAIVADHDPERMITASIDFIASLSVSLDRYSDMASSFTSEKLADISEAFAAGADVVMKAVTNGTDVSSAIEDDNFDLQEASVKCVISKANPDDEPKLASAVTIPKDQLQTLYAKFTKLLDSMIKMVKGVLYAGKDFKFSGNFFSVSILNAQLKDLPGTILETNLASITLPAVSDVSQMFTNLDRRITLNTTLSTAVVAYIANVLDVNSPFNMPTIVASVTFGDKQQILNRDTPIKILGKPIVKKAEIFSTQKKDAQCDISKVKCDLSENADQMGSLVRFPIKQGAGDFVLIIPVISFNYSAYIAFNSTPNVTRNLYSIYVTDKQVSTSVSDIDYPSLRTNYNQKVEVRILVSQHAITKFAATSQSPNYSISLYVFLKRDFSNFDLSDLPSEACDLQRCYGYHLRVGAAKANKFSRRRRETSYGDDFELDPASTESTVAFTSNYFGEFGADLVITPNTIEFSEIYGANFASLLADNYAVFAVICSAVVLYLIGVVLAWRFDKTDLREWAFLPIISNRRQQKNRYLISVMHFSVRHYEQRPTIWIRLIGDIQETDWRLLEDGIRKNFQGKRPGNFTMTTAMPVGLLSAIEIKVSTRLRSVKPNKVFKIYIDKVMVLDIFQSRKYIFPMKTEFRTDQMERIDLATEDEIKSFRYLVNSHARLGISDSHPWLSVAQRPLPSNWTRVERLSCVVSALFMAMMVNTMFYGKETEAPKIGLNIGGFFYISWFTIWTSLVGSIIIIPPTTIIGFIFKHIQRRSAMRSTLATIFNISLPDDRRKFDENGKKIKKPLMLPFQCIFIAWFLVGASVAVSAFIIISYSLMWGRQKSLQWLCSIVLHIVQDIIAIQTIKVLIFSIFNSTFLDLPDDGLNIGRLTFAKNNTKTQSELFIRLRNTIGGIVHHIIYVIAFTLVIGTAHNAYCYRQVRDLTPLVTIDGLDPVSGVVNDYSMIMNWLSKKLLPNFLSGNQISYGGIFKASNIYRVTNHDVVLVGPIRLRQQRTRKASCPLQDAVVAPTSTQRYVGVLANPALFSCQKPYWNSLGIGESSETRLFYQSWSAVAVSSASLPSNEQEGLSVSPSPWVYSETDGVPYSGWQASYKTGGYYVDLPTRLSSAQAVVADLSRKRWLDNATTVLFVDFVLYNAQINLFIAVKIVFEALNAGGMGYSKSIYPLNLYQYSGGNAMLAYAIQALWVLVMLSHVIRIALTIKKSGFKKFRTDGWNLFDMCQVLFSLGIVGLFAARIYYIIEVITRMQNDKSTFVSLDLLVIWEDLMLNLYGIALFMTLMLFFRHLQANKFWAIFLATLSNGKYDLISFVFLFTFITMMFACLGYGTMGVTREEFRTVNASLMTLIQNIIGVTGSLMTLASQSRFIMVYCMAYSFIVMFLAVQIFMSIISVVYGNVSSDVEKMTSWDAHLANYIASEWTKLLRIGPQGKETTINASLSQLSPKPTHDLEDAVARLATKVDNCIKDTIKQERCLLAWASEHKCKSMEYGNNMSFQQALCKTQQRRPVERSARSVVSSFSLRMTNLKKESTNDDSENEDNVKPLALTNLELTKTVRDSYFIHVNNSKSAEKHQMLSQGDEILEEYSLQPVNM